MRSIRPTSGQASRACFLLVCLALVLGLATMAVAQTTQQFANANTVTGPTGGIILPGTRINPNTGQPVRYLWYGDAGAVVSGLCRFDPDIDTPGLHTLN